MKRRLWLGLVVAGSVLPGTTVASDLSWSGPAECRQSEQLTFQVERALGSSLAQVGQVHLQVHIQQLEPDARALLRVAQTNGDAAEVKKRLLTAPDCATLVDTLAVAIALAVEAAAPEREAALAEATPPQPALLRAPLAAPEPGTGLVPRVAALLVADAGSLPAPALGVGSSVALAARHWQLELLGTLWLEQHPSLERSPVTGAGANLSLLTAALLGCALPWGPDALSASFCAGLELGRLAGEGTGVSNPRRPDALWLAPGLHAGLSWQVPATQLRLGARIGAVLPLERHELVLENLGTVYQPARLAARAALGLDLAFE